MVSLSLLVGTTVLTLLLPYLSPTIPQNGAITPIPRNTTYNRDVIITYTADQTIKSNGPAQAAVIQTRQVTIADALQMRLSNSRVNILHSDVYIHMDTLSFLYFMKLWIKNSL